MPFALPLLCTVSQIAFGGDSAVFVTGPGAALHVGGARTVWYFDSASTPSSVPPSSALPVGSSLGQCCTAIQWSAPLASSVLAAISSWDDQPVAARLLQTSSAQAHLECIDVRADHQWMLGSVPLAVGFYFLGHVPCRMLPQPLFESLSSSEPDHVDSRAGSPVAARRSAFTNLSAGPTPGCGRCRCGCSRGCGGCWGRYAGSGRGELAPQVVVLGSWLVWVCFVGIRSCVWLTRFGVGG